VDIGLADERNIFKAYQEFNGVTPIEMTEELDVDVKKLRAMEKDSLMLDSEIIFNMYENGIFPSAFLRNKNCVQSEMSYLLNLYSGKVGEELLMVIRISMLIVI